MKASLLALVAVLSSCAPLQQAGENLQQGGYELFQAGIEAGKEIVENPAPTNIVTEALGWVALAVATALGGGVLARNRQSDQRKKAAEDRLAILEAKLLSPART